MTLTHLIKCFSIIFLYYVSACSKPSVQTADKIFVNGKIYTAVDKKFVEAMAVNGSEVNAVGLNSKIQLLTGPNTEVIDLAGQVLMPGLIDTHIHPIASMDVAQCDLESRAMDLAELSALVQNCLAGAEPSDHWFEVAQWNFTAGNQPAGGLFSIRQALDKIPTTRPIILLGNDGHHYGVNSIALSRAKTSEGKNVGLSRDTLETDFVHLAKYIGLDERGELNGRVTENYALKAMGSTGFLGPSLDAHRRAPEKLMDVTLPNGITAFMDAAADPNSFDIYDGLEKNGKLKARVTLAQFYDPMAFVGENETVNYNAILAGAEKWRNHFGDSELIQANFLKLFADGVMEGDPRAHPPTLPNAALSREYLNPVFEMNEDGSLSVSEYKSEPGGSGKLQMPKSVIENYVQLGDAAGFTFLIHAIGDRAVETALGAIEQTQVDTPLKNRHILTHLQLVRPNDIERFAATKTFASFTFAWAVRDETYDMTVIPFIEDVTGPHRLYDPKGYYYQNVYPARSLENAGVDIISGSDAPVDTRNPRPFVNMAGAIARSFDAAAPLNGDQAISLEDAIASYTSTAAEAIKLSDKIGTLEPGKKADFIILDRDIFAAWEKRDVEAFAGTQVKETWFNGERVYSAD